ncbi:MAG: DUF2914 domain-containing protein [Sandaracinaceae bacterium]|nr:DUF2914 domain-containing protein [Sandaracinaceae bacterium]
MVELSRVIVARRIEDREPVGLAPFDGDVDELFVFLDARNDGAPATLQVRWDAPDGTPGRAIDLQVPTARRWRTWATTNRVRGRAGTWTVVVTDASGREIARRSFTVDAPAAS